MASRTHHVPPGLVHHAWDVRNEPAVAVASGDVVTVETRDVTDGQVGPGARHEALASLDPARLYPLAGPVWVDGASPGDTLAIEILEVEPDSFGWAGIWPGFGLLQEEFPGPYLRTFDLSDGTTAEFREDITIPLEPFFGTIGVCPAGAR